MLYIRNKNDTILYKYDNQGNTLEQKSNNGTITYQYDIYNRTRQVVTENGDIIKNKYDPLGFRYQKEVNGDTNRYIFDGWNVIAETNKEGELKSREVRGYSLVKKEKEETTYYYHQNEHGDVTHLTNVDEEIENSYSYDVFGNIREQQENVKNIFKYTGEQFDKETQQYYLRARFYNPVIGRFIQEDIYRDDGLNLYVYVINNPLLWIDPSGYAKCLKGIDDQNEQQSLKKIYDETGNRIPYGFNSLDEYNNFTAALKKALPEGTEIYFQGSAVTGVSHRLGLPFDYKRRSDFDIGLVNDNMFIEALEAGYKMKTQPNRIGPINKEQIKELGLVEVKETAMNLSKRDVNFMLFEDSLQALKRPSIKVN